MKTCPLKESFRYKRYAFRPYGKFTEADTEESLAERIYPCCLLEHTWDYEKFYEAARGVGDEYSVFIVGDILVTPTDEGLRAFRLTKGGIPYPQDEPYKTKKTLISDILKAVCKNEVYEYKGGIEGEQWDIAFSGKLRMRCVYTYPNEKICDYGKCAFKNEKEVREFLNREICKA